MTRTTIEPLESRAYLSGAVGTDHLSFSHIAPAAMIVSHQHTPVAAPQDLQAAADISHSTAGVAADKITSIPYRLFAPTLTSRKQKVPLILFMHGLGDSGTDNVAQTYWMSGLRQATASGADAAFILAPQLPTGWVFGYSGAQTEGMNLVMIALTQAMKNPNVDLKRIYVTGISMGAYGVWDILRRNPKLFAAAVPMSYGGDVSTAATIAKSEVPIWAFQGSADTTQPPARMRAMIAALVKDGGSPRYTEIPGAGHQIWNDIYSGRPSLYKWLFSQKRK